MVPHKTTKVNGFFIEKYKLLKIFDLKISIVITDYFKRKPSCCFFKYRYNSFTLDIRK